MMAVLVCTLRSKKKTRDMDAFMEAVIKNEDGRAKMTELYQIMQHTRRCARCKTRFGQIAQKFKFPIW